MLHWTHLVTTWLCFLKMANSIWEHVSKQADEDWVERCSLRVSGEWRGGGRVCWGPQSAERRGRTLLVSGSLLLAERCEVQLLHITGEVILY
ncbi:unnamed protein product [Leptidea sinapis]|uniref:Secreted protein n=1 Tax=Leptidea sinapis TaxID=189913 RepID=A0A5E4PW94_9NEOP|nr:unnamed protein product [Leptidea sinapis]